MSLDRDVARAKTRSIRETAFQSFMEAAPMTALRSAKIVLALLASASVLAGCASTVPTGPMVDAAPGRGKSPAAFARDDQACQVTAQNAVGQSPGGAANEAAAGSAVAGTLLGAAAGAAIGSASGRMGAGAAIGAGTGLVAGSMIGAGNARYAAGSVQAEYDSIYAQCMAGRGNRIGGPAVAVAEPVYVYPPPPPRYYYPRPYYRGPYYPPGY
jgi:Glycine-zipper domain